MRIPAHEQALILYRKYGGRSHRRIEREMRELGYANFHRRVFYAVKRDGVRRGGWIERYGWNGHVPPAPGAGPDPFQSWLRTVAPEMEWDARHQQLIYSHLERITSGKSKRLMIFMPPRHGKSELVTIRYAAWRLWADPRRRIVIGSYAQSLADKFSRSIRRILSEEEDKLENASGAGGDKAGGGTRTEKMQQAVAPSASGPAGATRSMHTRMFPRARTRNTMSEWETAAGGGVKAVGMGAGITGFGADLVIVDDPVKSRAQAESPRFRDRVWDWFRDDICTRLEPGAPMILIQTRWHEDDLAGRILRDMAEGGEQWEVLSLPAIAEDRPAADWSAGIPARMSPQCERPAAADTTRSTPVPHSSDWRAAGEALWPARFPPAALLEQKRRIGSYSFSALYQQTPSPAEGGILKRAWFTRIIETPPPGLTWCRGYDLAVSTRSSADYTASFRVARDREGNIYIADGYRARIEFPEQRRYLLGRMRAEPSDLHGVEAALHGKALVQDIGREDGIGHIALRSVEVDADKVTRALAWAGDAEAGKVALVRGPWIDAFLEEIAAFPAGAHDDQIDAVSLAIRLLAEIERYRNFAF